MKKIVEMGLVLLVCIGILAGCGGDSYDADSSTVFVLKKGGVAVTDVESFNEGEFSKAELEDYVKNAVQKYTAENGKDLVVFKKLSVEDGMGYLTLTYASAEDYTDFTGTKLYTGTIANAMADGYDFDVSFCKAENGEEVSISEVLNDSSLNIVIFNGETTVVVPGDIVYYSVRNTLLVDSKTLSIGQETTEPGTEALISDVPEGTEEVGEDTEAIEGDGSVSDDEMLTGEESTEIHFEFGEDEDEDEEEDSSGSGDFYTYIIYK